MGAKQEGEKLLGQLPGTGGDFIDDNDVEGHGSEGGAKPEAKDVPKDEPEDDVEGHARITPTDGSEGLYRGGPTTQGEIVMRGPGDNPHGER